MIKYQASPKSHYAVTKSGPYGGIFAAKAINLAAVEITSLHNRKFHLFQPLYQAASGSRSPADTASSWAAVLEDARTVQF